MREFLQRELNAATDSFIKTAVENELKRGFHDFEEGCICVCATGKTDIEESTVKLLKLRTKVRE